MSARKRGPDGLAENAAQGTVVVRRPLLLPGVEVMRLRGVRHAEDGVHERHAFSMTNAHGARWHYRRRDSESPANQLVCFAPGEAYRVVKQPAIPAYTNVLIIDDRHLSRPKESLFNADPGACAAFNSLLVAIEDKRSDRLALSSAFLAFSSLVSDEEPRLSTSPPSSRCLERVRERICDEVSESPSIADLAHDARISREHLVRAFGARFGMPPHEYRMHIRIERARAMLAGGASATEVAFACGFSDQSHLNRWFKKVVGVTPGQYARAVS